MRNRIIVVLAVGALLWTAEPIRAAQVQCQSFNDCMTEAVCQNGACTGGVPVADGTPCNSAGPCMMNAKCQTFSFPPAPSITFCMGEQVQDGTPCTLLQNCFTPGQCSSGECMDSTEISCADNDPCTADFCNPNDGQCLHVPQCVTSDCVTGNSCDASGTCHPTPAPNGTSCNNGNVCTGNDQCVNGECMGTPIEKITPGGATATPSQTPTATSQASTATPTHTPTATATALPSNTPTTAPSATATEAPTDTPTLVPTEVATETPTVLVSDTPTPTEIVEGSPTPTTVPTPVCVGDCNGDGQVTVDELLTLVNIALGNLDVSNCLPGDVNMDMQITIDEVLAAVQNALGECPAAAASHT